jgi:hypothetical protein
MGFAEPGLLLSDIATYLKNLENVEWLSPIPSDLRESEVVEIERHIASDLQLDLETVKNAIPWMITKGGVEEQDYSILCLHQGELWSLGHQAGEVYSAKYLKRRWKISQIADWELKDGGLGFAVLRLLIFERSADLSIPLEDAIRDNTQYKLNFSYLWGTQPQRNFIAQMTRAIEKDGCFDPTGRSWSPLGREIGVALDRCWD